MEYSGLCHSRFTKSKLSFAGLILRGGARERTQFSPSRRKWSIADFATTRGCKGFDGGVEAG